MTRASRSANARSAYRARILTPKTGGGLMYLADGVLRVGDDGTIEAVHPFTPETEPGAVDLRHTVLLPGFVDLHIHYPQVRAVGSATGPLLDWLERTVFPEEARLRDIVYARALAAELVAALVRSGTTTAVVFGSSLPHANDVLFEALAASGLRAIAGPTLMDQASLPELCVPVAEAMPALERAIERWDGYDGGRLRVAVTPRFAISCSRELLAAAGSLASRRGLFVQTHACENIAEGAATLAAHPYADDYIDVYDRAGLLGERTILAHVVHATAREWDRIAERRSIVAHCPDSNFFLGSGRMKLEEARRRGVRVALGTDVAAGRSFSIRRAMASAFDNALCTGLRLGAAELLHLATLGGAAALGLDDVLGSLEPGKEADFVAVRVPEWASGEAEVLSHVIFATDDASVERTFVRGRPL